MEGWGVLCLILWLLCSVICYAIMKSKGYPNDVCLKNGIGGFFLGLIWVVVVLCKGQCPTPANYNSNEQKSQPSLASSDVTDAKPLNVMEQIAKLAELKSTGAITEAEFTEKKANLLKKL